MKYKITAKDICRKAHSYIWDARDVSPRLIQRLAAYINKEPYREVRIQREPLFYSELYTLVTMSVVDYYLDIIHFSGICTALRKWATKNPSQLPHIRKTLSVLSSFFRNQDPQKAEIARACLFHSFLIAEAVTLTGMELWQE